MSLREELISNLKALDGDDGVSNVLQEAKRVVRPDSLILLMRRHQFDSSSLTFAWPMFTDHLRAHGLAFGDVIHRNDRSLRVIAYDSKSDKLFTTDPNTADGTDHIGNYASKAGTVTRTIPSERDRVIRVLENAGDDVDDQDLVRMAASRFAQVHRTSIEHAGLSFEIATRSFFGPSSITFSWDNMTTDLRGRGLAFGDVVDGGRRAIAFRDGVMWVAKCAPETSQVEKM